MSLIDQLQAEENKKKKLFHAIIMASATLQRNIEMSKKTEIETERKAFLDHALTDAIYIEELALLANSGKKDK